MSGVLKEKVVESEGSCMDGGFNTRSARWGRRGVIASLLIGMGALAVKSFFWLHFSPADSGEYQVIAEWQIAADSKGVIIAISPHSSAPERLRALGKRLRDSFRRVDNAAIMIFDDPAAAWQVRKGSRNIDETRFQAALRHQRAMYLKNSARGEDSFTIYDSYPKVSEVIRFGKENLTEPAR